MNSPLFLITIILSLELLLVWGIDLKSQKLSDTKVKLAKADIIKARNDETTTEGLDVFATDSPEVNNATQDHHIYYNSTFYSNANDAKKFWVDFDSLPVNQVTVLEKLSNAYRQATTIELTFDFPFYGSPLRNVTVATGGFLYVGDYVHNWLAATQYIAPLMANFDTRLSPDSLIKYIDNGTMFTVQWNKVHVQGTGDLAFTFQATLYKTGDIVFAYRDIPYPVTNISDSLHPVKIGISDAYILERSTFFIRRKTVYEYHRIAIELPIANNTALYFTALPTCTSFKSCSSCVSSSTALECSWCSAVERCSNGIDRQMQNWLSNGCNTRKETTCLANGTSTSESDMEVKTKAPVVEVVSKSSSKQDLTSKSSPYQVNTVPSSEDISDQQAAHLTHDTRYF